MRSAMKPVEMLNINFLFFKQTSYTKHVLVVL